MDFKRGIICVVRIIFIINALVLVFRGQMLLTGLLLGSLALTFIPELFSRFTGVKITMGGRVTFVVFLLGTQWLGTYLRFYDSLIWWDIMLHFSSGFLLGYTGLLILIWIDKQNMTEGRTSPVMIYMFVFLVAVSGAVFWEIGEFLSDTFFGSNTQLGSLRDTMEDMIYGTIGGGLFVLYLFYSSCKKRDSCLNRLVYINKEVKDK